MTPETALDHLAAIAARNPGLIVAVSGGVDSLTLATALGRSTPGLRVAHSVSPAVPPEATARVREMAAREGWTLLELDTGEFADPDYLANPANRCYFCKSNLYTRILARTGGPVASGTNLDDLGDYRPGLAAAAEAGVMHPFVEAGLAKPDVRALARHLGLPDIARLPAQPCLSSRVETGLPIRRADLAFIHHIETLVQGHVDGGDIRCRITAEGVRLELSALSTSMVHDLVALECAAEGRPFLGISPYRRGSAFLRDPT